MSASKLAYHLRAAANYATCAAQHPEGSSWHEWYMEGARSFMRTCAEILEGRPR